MRINASVSLSSSSGSLIFSALAKKHSSVSTNSETRTRCKPSTSTFTVPSGSFSICNTVANVPISYKSSASGSSLLADFCATSRICLLPSEAISSALTDLVRPTNNGITKCGYTTTSRKGSSGIKPCCSGEAVSGKVCSIIKYFRIHTGTLPMLLSWEHSLIVQGLISTKLCDIACKHYKPPIFICNSLL